MKAIEDLNWRYATKKFDPTKKISDTELQTLLEVLRLSPSSYGLQPLKFLIVENKELREKLKEKSWGQPQVTDASHFIILCSYIDIHDEHIDKHIENTALTREGDPANFVGYSNFMKASINKLSPEEKKVWNSKQAYIALGHLLHSCAQMRIDSVPMEGFEADGYDEILNLKAQNLHAVLACPIGYRSDEDTNQHLKKVRKEHNDLFEFIR